MFLLLFFSFLNIKFTIHLLLKNCLHFTYYIIILLFSLMGCSLYLSPFILCFSLFTSMDVCVCVVKIALFAKNVLCSIPLFSLANSFSYFPFVSFFFNYFSTKQRGDYFVQLIKSGDSVLFVTNAFW